VAAGQLGRRGERGRPLGGTQRGELVDVHAPILPTRLAPSDRPLPRRSRPFGRDALALSLTEC
ncbi:hypothetical protein ABT214_28315, partial [Micromonospora purpureochromogenes]|uniref:hypothetical protein n=1 Tax=Micromonospora purpureochromogenes TaxID=47872 RepID=UPI00331A568D